jgi:hypothetical protein
MPAAGGQDVIDTKPIADAVAEAIKKNPTLFPKGTALQRIRVRGGVAALDFNSEFGKLGNLGDTVESHTQRKLRAALAQFPAVEKMTITVDGKPYDSQTADWTTPIPVRLSPEEREADPSTSVEPPTLPPPGGGSQGDAGGGSPGVGLPIRSGEKGIRP